MSREFAKFMRQNPTEAENRLWYYLRAKRTFDVKFKRQVPIGRYIVDFACLSHRLIIEADGGQHADGADIERDAVLRQAGFTVLRFWNHEIMQQTEAVLEAIRLALQDLQEPQPSPPAPFPQAGEG
ncbi:MAG: endonuclease domain-containing protein [Formosimonas sp.]